MKLKNTPTNDRTSTGLYKGTPLVCAIHKYLEAIWTVTIIAIAITICLSINPKDDFIFSFFHLKHLSFHSYIFLQLKIIFQAPIVLR